MRPDAILTHAHIEYHTSNTLGRRIGWRSQAYDIANTRRGAERSGVATEKEPRGMLDPGISIVDRSRRCGRSVPRGGNLRRDFSKCWHTTAHIQASVCVTTDGRLSNVDNSGTIIDACRCKVGKLSKRASQRF